MQLLCIKKTDILKEVEDIAVAQAFNVLSDVRYLLEILVLAVIEDRIIDDNPIDRVVSVGS